MLAIRAPFAALGGAVLSVGLFFGLAQLVNVSFEMKDQILVDPVAFKSPRVETPVHPTRDPKVERPPLERPPGLPGFNEHTDVRVKPLPYPRPPLDPRPTERGSGLRRIDGDVTPIVFARPEYPARALTGNIEGWVQVRFTVTAIGTVRDAVVVGSEPGTVFDEAALKAIARWRYNPRVENGEAVERVGLQYVFRFELEN